MDLPSQLQHSHAAAVANNLQSSASSAGPQIRSRITVVCAECKRLKLKCDRRAPCGSCTKRDTVVRCVYSPAAAEKVDLHSLNNRIIQLETAFAMFTSGQLQLPFQPSYPASYPNSQGHPQQPSFSLGASSSAGSHNHQHHHHYAVKTYAHDSLSFSTTDLESICLDELGLSLASSSAQASSSGQQYRSFSVVDNGLIKLEPSPVDIELSNSQTDTHTDAHSSPPIPPPSPTRRSFHIRMERQHQQHQQRSSAQLLLPALSIYYPIPSIPSSGTDSSSAPFPHHPPHASPSSTPPSTSSPSISANFGHRSPSHLHPQHAKPQVTQALLGLLPSLAACTRFLQNAHDLFRVRPIPFEGGPGQGWSQFENRCLTLLGGGVNQERERERERKEREREKARMARRARQIYFGGIPGLQSHVTQDADVDDLSGAGHSRGSGRVNGETDDAQGPSDDHSLTFFAVMCAVLAVGASIPSQSNSLTTATDAIKESPAFLYALSQQALGVWDTHASSVASEQPLTVAEETEKMDYLLACIAGLCFLLFSNSPARATGPGEAEREAAAGSGVIVSLVGKLVNAARGMGLARDSSVLPSFQGRKGKPTGEVPVSERRGTSLARGTSGGGGTPSKGVSKREREAERERIREEWKKMVWWEVLFYDLFTADALGHQAYTPSHLYGVRLPGCSASALPSQADEQDSDDESDGGQDASNEDFGSRRARPSQNPSSTVVSDTTEHEDDYLGARYRLTQIAQDIKNRLTHPDCCCGYTIDLAAQLEAEIRRWQNTLPLSLRWSQSPAENTVPFHMKQTTDLEKIVHLQSCELAVIGNMLLVKVYTPFLRHAAASASSSEGHSPSRSALDAVPITSTAAQTAVHAAQMIIRAVTDAYDTQAAITIFTPHSSLTSPSASPAGKTHAWLAPVSPAMFDLYPLDKVVFHAAVLCAHAGLSTKTPPAMSVDTDAALAAARVALSALVMEQGTPSVGPLGDTQRKIVEVLYHRVVARINSGSHGMKRKHSQISVSANFGKPPSEQQSNATINLSGTENEWANAGDSAAANGQQQQHQHHQYPQHSVVELPVSPLSAVNLSFPQNLPPRSEDDPRDLGAATRISAAVRAAQRADGEKEKKYAKKMSYPSVGVRLRPGKEAGSRGGRQQSLSTLAQIPLMTSTPRPLPSAESVLTFQQQQKQKLQAANEPPPPTSDLHLPTSAYDEEERSRSSSFSHIPPHDSHQLHQQQQHLQHQQHQQQHEHSQQQQQQLPQHAEDMQYPFFAPSASSDMLNMQMNPRRRFSINEQQQPLSPEQPFVFEQPLGRLYEQSYDNSTGSVDPNGYSSVSSPFSNGGGPTSSTGSPFTAASSGHPSTPTFGAQPTAPVFGPQPDALSASTSSPTTYYHTPTAFSDGSYSGTPHPPTHLSHQQQQHGSHGISLGSMGMEISMPDSQTYDKAHAGGIYDMKTAIDPQHQPQRQMQQQSLDAAGGYEEHSMAGQNHALGMGMPADAAWSEQPRQQQHQPAHAHAHGGASSNQQPFWNNGTDYNRYYP